jgi:hypothetical protein
MYGVFTFASVLVEYAVFSILVSPFLLTGLTLPLRFTALVSSGVFAPSVGYETLSSSSEMASPVIFSGC